jgi:hypothetical protein
MGPHRSVGIPDLYEERAVTDRHANQSRAKTRRPTTGNALASDRERQALDLRKAGASFDAIAKQLGYSDPSGAHRAVTRALDRIPNEAAASLRVVEAERLDRLLLAVWKDALAGDLKAMDRALRILDQRARLLGLNLPVKAEVDMSVSQVDPGEIEIVQRIKAWKAAQEGPAAPE